jgi:CDP-2,3-bis-(O-geranylgeranyl)-sn-glycerol synthase
MRLLSLIYLMLPAYCANMAPPFVKYWPGWNRPINERLFGAHKTIVGFGAGVVVGIFVAFLQSLVAWKASPWAPGDWPVVGLASGFGAMLGDSVKSLFKRKRHIAPGRPWIPADQLDFVIGALLLLWPLVRIDVAGVAFILVFSFVADVAVNQASYVLGIRDTRW